ncbi:hypothetical protein [Roseobacter ponti]|uniref:Lipopolysaccharide export system protein LptC n=1 Tax=Roseobacter ponti TaxID=1891787 RepID=A0A858SMR9_9RHOB|nr:hypothetical protein [Roseobacter ponti]QJF49790.1 hypothetical protein G3256_00715 [Roseobacter ponti]
MQVDSYSRTVAWLKVALPLMALALLSTLFLLSRAIDPTASIPFADPEVRDRLANQQLTGPYFSGTTANGDQISLIAETVTSPQDVVGETRALDVFVRMELASGTGVNVKADNASVDLQRDRSALAGNVVLTTTQGWQVRSQLLNARLTSLELLSPGTVFALTPGGELTAGKMRMFSPGAGEAAQMVFTNGVKLVYQPKQVEE